MRSLLEDHRPWAVALAVGALSVAAAPSDAARRPTAPTEHAPVEAAEVIEFLWSSQEGAKRAVAAEDFDAVHGYEFDIDAALHDLEASADALPEPRRQAAHERLAALFEVVDGLHEGAELGDSRALAALLVRLGILIGQLEPVLMEPTSGDSHASSPDSANRQNTTRQELSS